MSFFSSFYSKLTDKHLHVISVISRLDRDRGDGEPDALTTVKVLKHLSDWKIWALSVAFGCATMPSYALAYFM